MLDAIKEMLKDIQKMEDEDTSRVHILERMHGFKLFHDENDVTNEEILKYDLVGVVDVTLEGLPSINVIKNTMNGVIGKIPTQMWLSLVDDKINESEQDTKEAPVSEPKKNEFDKMFDELTEVFSDVFSEGLATATETIDDAIENISIKLELAELKMIREKAIKNKVQTKGFLKKIDKRILLLEALLKA